MPFNLLDSISIDRRSRVPYELQIKDRIKAFILDQKLYYKSVLPKPKELANRLNIKDRYVQHAYHQLLEERYIKKEATDVYNIAYFELTNYFFDRNTAVYDAIEALGLSPSIECVEKKLVQLSDEEVLKIGFEPSKDNTFFYINRIYLGDKQPIMLLENYLPLAIFEDIDKDFNGDEPLDAYLKEQYGLKAQISKRIIKAVNLPKSISKHLKERPNVASIQSTNKVYDHLGRLIDFGRSHTISSYYFQTLVTKQDIDYLKKGLDNT